jgi:hypothetical protein
MRSRVIEGEAMAAMEYKLAREDMQMQGNQFKGLGLNLEVKMSSAGL